MSQEIPGPISPAPSEKAPAQAPGERKQRPEPFSDEWTEAALKEIGKELAEVGPALKDFIEKVIEEKPDVIVFLDKGARIFGTPIKDFLNSLGLPQVPQVIFYNDDGIKNSFLRRSLDKEIVETEFSQIKDKKVFFFDETFCEGKGALAIRKAGELLGNEEFHYFSLTRDPQGKRLLDKRKAGGRPMLDIPIEEYLAAIEKLEQDDKFTIYDNERAALFSRVLAPFYVTQVSLGENWARTVHNTSEKLQTISDIADNNTMRKKFTPAQKIHEMERMKRYNMQTFALIGKVKAEILKTLKNLEIEKQG